MPKKSAIAVGAHPDDIEFYMAGTLLMLKQAGYEIHYFSVANGNCGSAQYNAAALRAIRNTEARAGARILGATFHPSVTNDLEIFYNLELLRAVSAVIREVKPTVVLTHSPQDYMEDHMTASRLAVTAAFARGMPNFKTSPSREAEEYEVTVYHAMPHGLRDPLGRRIIPGAFVNTTPVQAVKREALAAHKSQQHWLDKSQRINCFLLAMENMALDVGRMSKRFKCAEGWRPHLHLGFCKPEADPLRDALGKDYLINPAYEKSLDKGI
jgi:LmbE family N-acetylglucosaminyl deacetylase